MTQIIRYKKVIIEVWRIRSVDTNPFFFSSGDARPPPLRSVGRRRRRPPRTHPDHHLPTLHRRGRVHRDAHPPPHLREPVVIFSRSSCCMCHVMKRLLSTVGVHPTVIELEEDEISALSPRGDNNNNSETMESSSAVHGGASVAPALYIGGACVGGMESLVALHLSNNLVPKLVECIFIQKVYHKCDEVASQVTNPTRQT
ncbi:hypothetical protein DH2020_001808 [Rehmannia glutinosa]|uniref:Glutaredoxin domain-containing protein n=1 Tax=Rehmannia glutinosa TaxID=99300 RepID=A0ABR0XRY4_REHGL